MEIYIHKIQTWQKYLFSYFERFLLEFSVYLQIEYTSYFLSTLYTGNQS